MMCYYYIADSPCYCERSSHWFEWRLEVSPSMSTGLQPVSVCRIQPRRIFLY